MPRMISFMLTTPQFKARTKTVTRRLGWWFLRGGETLTGVEQSQGIKKGEHVVRLGDITVKSVSHEPLNTITQSDVIREGFPDMTPAEFVAFFCAHNKCAQDVMVNRIEFEYLTGVSDEQQNTC